MRIGIDAGGTFTDFIVLHDDGRLEAFKIPSNPAAPARVILEGIARAAGRRKVEVVHGSTVATNALLERKGARTALVTTAGFEDVIQIGRQNRAELYNLNPPPKRMLVERELRFGVGERTYFDGTVERAPSREGLEALKVTLREAGVASVAICFLHSYQNEANEAAAAKALAGDWYLCASYEISPEFREYERTSTTVLNAYVGPLMDRYLAELENGTRCPLSIMQSNGGLISATEARGHAVRTLLSGPAGGVVGAIESAKLSGFTRVLGFDMGGTSTDVSLAEGTPRHTMDASIDGFPIRVPVLNIHTVGAGGGSIARVDEGGLLRVGPESAGADPGPACYGKGVLPTVTDAHVVLGRIAADQFLGGAMHIDVGRAEAAVDSVAAALRLTRTAAAEGIIRVANANMQRAIRTVSIERGHDPRLFALVAFGGCGGLHACDIADELGIRTVLAPEHAGVLSALGMLMADRVRDYSTGVIGRADIEKQYVLLERRARRDLRGAVLQRYADVRYTGQSYELTVNAPGEFHAEHEKIYGYSDSKRPIELVAIRVRAIVTTPKLKLRKTAGERTKPSMRRMRVGSQWREIPAFRRAQLSRKPIAGPALVLDYGATTYVPPGWTVAIDAVGTLTIRK
jgi:N-methylhydantoinase A